MDGYCLGEEQIQFKVSEYSNKYSLEIDESVFAIRPNENRISVKIAASKLVGSMLAELSFSNNQNEIIKTAKSFLIFF